MIALVKGAELCMLLQTLTKSTDRSRGKLSGIPVGSEDIA